MNIGLKLTGVAIFTECRIGIYMFNGQWKLVKNTEIDKHGKTFSRYDIL